MTIGWNCQLEHGELRIPKIAPGLVESLTDDSLETRERRGLQAFSLVAQNSNGVETLGISANDRITTYSELMKKDRLSRRNILHHSVEGIGWPALLAMAVSAVGLVIVVVALYRYKVKKGLSCAPCAEGTPDAKEGDATITVEENPDGDQED